MQESPTSGGRARHPGARHKVIESPRGTVVTLLEPELRSVIDAATHGTIGNIHVDSPSEAVRAVREHSPSALLLSPMLMSRYPAVQVSSLVARSLGVTAVAVLGANWMAAQDSLLGLGGCGVRHVVNLAEREGWDRLRRLIFETGGDCRVIVTQQLLSAVGNATEEVKEFLATLVRIAPETGFVCTFARGIGIEPSTLMSRFYRARLPAPKKYLSMTRLLYAAWFLEEPRVSVAAAADVLRYSSPQSFGRHVRTTLGLTAAEFRREMPLRVTLDHYRSRLIDPYLDTLSWFRPLGPKLSGRDYEWDLAS